MYTTFPSLAGSFKAKKEQNKINTEKLFLNNFVNYFSDLGFYSSTLFLMLFSHSESNDTITLSDKIYLTKIVYRIMQLIFTISTISKMSTTISKNKCESKKEYITKTNQKLQEKKMELNNTLIHLLINALEETKK